MTRYSKKTATIEFSTCAVRAPNGIVQRPNSDTRRPGVHNKRSASEGGGECIVTSPQMPPLVPAAEMGGPPPTGLSMHFDLDRLKMSAYGGGLTRNRSRLFSYRKQSVVCCVVCLVEIFRTGNILIVKIGNPVFVHLL